MRHVRKQRGVSVIVAGTARVHEQVPALLKTRKLVAGSAAADVRHDGGGVSRISSALDYPMRPVGGIVTFAPGGTIAREVHRPGRRLAST